MTRSETDIRKNSQSSQTGLAHLRAFNNTTRTYYFRVVLENVLFPNQTGETGYLSLKTFDQVTNCHTARNGMRIDYHVRGDSFNGEWHVLNKNNRHGERDGTEKINDDATNLYKII